MLTKLWEGVGEGLAEKWVAQLGPAIVFWFCGLYFWLGWVGLVDLSKTLLVLDILQQLVLIVGVLLLVTTSANLVQRMSYPVLRFLEGYWPSILYWLENWMTRRVSKITDKYLDDWSKLQTRIKSGEATRLELRRSTILDQNLHYMPSDPQDYMPTQLGNILRMAETMPRHVYGLDAVVCWTHLWMLFPETMREGVGSIRKQLDQSSELWLWGILFMVWARFTWLAIPIGLFMAWIAYRLSLNTARNYADLILTGFDLYRFDLYRSLHLEPPENSKQEKDYGEKITEYLWRGNVPKDGWVYKITAN